MRSRTWAKIGLCAAWLTVLGGCARTMQERSSFSDADMQALIEAREAEDIYLRSQTDLGLEARRLGPGSIRVVVTNKSNTQVPIGPQSFRIIVTGSRELVAPEPASNLRFPQSLLAPGDQAAGELVFPDSAAQAGQRLAVNVPDLKPAMALIE